MIIAYLLWAHGEPGTWTRAAHLASALPLALALLRFDWLTRHQPGRPAEELVRARLAAAVRRRPVGMGWMMLRRVLLLGGTSEIGLGILAALGLPPGTE